MTILVLTANTTPQDGGSLYGAEDTHDATGHIDTYINEGDTLADNSASAFISILDFSGGDEQRPYLKFDMSDLPASATITGSHLQMYAEAGQTSATIGAYGCKQDADALANWTHYNTADDSWATAGAKNTTSDIDSSALGTDVYDTTNSTWYNWSVTDWVQDVTDSTRSNYGLILARTTLPSDSHYVNFTSSGGTDGQRPELWIEYTAGGGSSPLSSILPIMKHIAGLG